MGPSGLTVVSDGAKVSVADKRYAIIADYVDGFDPALERCWIAERNGQNVGSVFVAKDPTRPAPSPRTSTSRRRRTPPAPAPPGGQP